MIKMKNKLILVIISLFFVINIINCNEKQEKVDACLRISKARIGQDAANFNSLIETLSQGAADKDEATNKILTLILLTCYQKIDFFSADDINRKYKDFKKIPAMNEEFKELLGLEKWQDLLLGNDQQKLEHEMAGLQEVLREIKSEELNLGMSDKENSNNQNKEEQPEAQDIKYDKQNKVDFNLFGINLTKLDSWTKNFIGISLIFLIFFTVIYALYWIKQLRQKEVKKPKRKSN